jgi:formylglycine-generating enzyme required for sulfatase activity
MKKTLQRQGVLWALALLVSVCAMACGPGESSGKKRDQQPATGEAAQTAKPGGIAKPSEAPKPGDVDTVDLGGGVKMELVWVPAGSFQMGTPDSVQGRAGDEGPVHRVELDGFWMGKYEVTNGQYRQFMKDSGYDGSGEAHSFYLMHFKRSVKESPPEDDYPVVWVSWRNAKAFCAWLSKKTGRSFGLPSVKQWEFACRAGSTGDYCFGSGSGQLGEYAWYDKNSGGQTHPVGRKKPNAFGLHDVHGNVCEWCEDEEEGSRVFRGGSWLDTGLDCCVSLHARHTPKGANFIIGFRIVCIGPLSR